MFDDVDNSVPSGSHDPNSDDDIVTAFSSLLLLFDVRLSLCV